MKIVNSKNFRRLFVLLLITLFSALSLATNDNIRGDSSVSTEHMRLVMFYSDHCQWCELQKKSVLNLSNTFGIKVRGISDEPIAEPIFEENEHAITYFREFGVRGYPTTFLWNMKTNQKTKLAEGFVEQAALSQKIQEALASHV